MPTRRLGSLSVARITPGRRRADGRASHTRLGRPGAKGGIRTPTVAHWILNPARLPVPPLSLVRRESRIIQRPGIGRNRPGGRRPSRARAGRSGRPCIVGSHVATGLCRRPGAPVNAPHACAGAPEDLGGVFLGRLPRKTRRRGSGRNRTGRRRPSGVGRTGTPARPSLPAPVRRRSDHLREASGLSGACQVAVEHHADVAYQQPA